MVYSQAKVIAGGLAHIPIVISVFYLVMTTFNKRALEKLKQIKEMAHIRKIKYRLACISK